MEDKAVAILIGGHHDTCIVTVGDYDRRYIHAQLGYRDTLISHEYREVEPNEFGLRRFELYDTHVF